MTEPIPRGRWTERVHQGLCTLLEGDRSASCLAALDWDHTSIRGDISYALFDDLCKTHPMDLLSCVYRLLNWHEDRDKNDVPAFEMARALREASLAPMSTVTATARAWRGMLAGLRAAYRSGHKRRSHDFAIAAALVAHDEGGHSEAKDDVSGGDRLDAALTSALAFDRDSDWSQFGDDYFWLEDPEEAPILNREEG